MASACELASLIVWLVACAAPTRHDATPRAAVREPVVTPTTPEAPPIAPVVAPAPPIPPSLALLDIVNHEHLSAISIIENERCPPPAGRSWIVSGLDDAGRGTTCIGEGAAPRCVAFAGVTSDHLTDVMCKELARQPVAVPRWAELVLSTLHAVPEGQTWTVAPIRDASILAAAIKIDDELFIAIRAGGRWQRSDVPIDGLLGRARAHQVLDASALTGAPSFGVVTSSYDGGSEMGTEITMLSIFRWTATGLAPSASIQLGRFTWFLAASDRRKFRNAATSLAARPHVEVRLAPTIIAGILTLRIERDVLSRSLAGRCDRTSDLDGDEELSPSCLRAELRSQAGRYRLVDDEFVRVHE